jgi:hypothetical protein
MVDNGKAAAAWHKNTRVAEGATPAAEVVSGISGAR